MDSHSLILRGHLALSERAVATDWSVAVQSVAGLGSLIIKGWVDAPSVVCRVIPSARKRASLLLRRLFVNACLCPDSGVVDFTMDQPR